MRWFISSLVLWDALVHLLGLVGSPLIEGSQPTIHGGINLGEHPLVTMCTTEVPPSPIVPKSVVT